MSACSKTLAVPAGVPRRAVLIMAVARTSVSVLGSMTDDTSKVSFEVRLSVEEMEDLHEGREDDGKR